MSQTHNTVSHITQLNDRQRDGVLATDGPVLVIAGAGSGKTKMLTARIIHLMTELEVPGHNILAVTFTNKAAGEMRERVGKALGLDVNALTPPPPYFRGASTFSQPTIGTFHSVCTRILRREIERTPFKAQFVIYDDSDQLSLVKDCFSRLNISDKMFSAKAFQHGINQAKCAALEPHEIQGSELNLYTKNLARVYALYQHELFKNNAIDFGEIITLTFKVLRDHPDVLTRYHELYRYIHVDEYQDTNRAQYLLVKLLAARHRNLCVVGDEDQSIYKWRGADIRNILDFERDYPEAAIIKLEQNYRSTQTIIKASSRLIANNASRKSKTLWTDNEIGERIHRFQASDDRAEAENVVANLKRECAESGYAYNDVAVFYRTNAQSRILEDILRREKIPYKIVGGLKFYDRKEIKDVMAYFRVILNGADSVSFKRIINVPQRSIGKATVEKIEGYAIEKKLTFEHALREVVGSNDGTLTAAPKRKLGEFIRLLDELREQLHRKGLSDFYHELIGRTRYVEELKIENTEESLSRIDNLQEFDSIVIDFENDQRNVVKAAEGVGQAGEAEQTEALADAMLPLFLENVTLTSEQDFLETDSGAVNLMTLHTSKGLEFPLVFIVGMEEGLFPSIRSFEGENEEDVEEERRLCYVGMTRAKRKLYLSNAVCRRVYGNIVYHDPSRFFVEIPSEFVEFSDLSRFRMQAQQKTPRFGDYDQDGECAETETNVGRRVRHPTYGIGIIRSVEGMPADSKVTIEFANRMTKKFILKFANLEYI